MKTAKYYVLIALFVCGLGLVGTTDLNDEKREVALYCQMVAEWHSTNRQAGWPDYENKFAQLCNADGTVKEIR